MKGDPVGRLRDVLLDAFDSVLAPACATDSHSSGYDATLDTISTCKSALDDRLPEPEWHNNFGTAADFQVPAESGDLFQSWDWSTGSSSSGSSSDW